MSGRGRPKLLDKLGGATGLGTPINIGSIMALLRDQYGYSYEKALEYVTENHATSPSRNTAAKYYAHYLKTVGARADAILKDRKAITAADLALVRTRMKDAGVKVPSVDAIRRSIARNRALQEYSEAEMARLNDARAARHKYSITRRIFPQEPWNPARVRKAIEAIAADEEARIAKFDPNPPTLEVTITYRPAPKKTRRR